MAESITTITILTPVFKRNEFLQLWLLNIKNQTYPHEHLKVIVDECKSDEPFIQDIEEVKEYLFPIQIEHNVYNSRSGIGEKRNRLIKSCSTPIFQFFDSDDLYFPECVKYNYELMQAEKVSCVGSDKMVFSYVNDDYKLSGIDCGNKISLIHEATIMAKKKWFMSSNKFQKRNCGEGKRLFEGQTNKHVAISDVRHVMLCLVHDGNTVAKDSFKDEDTDKRLNSNIIELLDTIFKK